MPPKRKRTTTINNIPENVLEQIHGYLTRRTPRNSAAFETAFKRARRAAPRARPNRITNGPQKLEYPADYPLPGPAEVRELKQRLILITKLLRAIQTDVKTAQYSTRLERYTAFKNTLQHILESDRSFDTITKRHIRVRYETNDGFIRSLRSYPRNRWENPEHESIELVIQSSRHVLPFTVVLDIRDPSIGTNNRRMTFTQATLYVKMGKWEWYILGDEVAGYVRPVNVHLPMSVRRIRVNQQPGVFVSAGNYKIRHQLDTIDLVRLITLLRRTDPNISNTSFPNNFIHSDVNLDHIFNTYLLQNNNGQNINPNINRQQQGYLRPRPYNSNSNNNRRR
jgi:hypothetical protein